MRNAISWARNFGFLFTTHNEKEQLEELNSVVQLPFIIRTVVFEQAYKNVFFLLFFFRGTYLLKSFVVVAFKDSKQRRRRVGKIEQQAGTLREKPGKTRALTTCCSPCFCPYLLVVICHNLVALPCNIVAGHRSCNKNRCTGNKCFGFEYSQNIIIILIKWGAFSVKDHSGLKIFFRVVPTRPMTFFPV